MSQQVVSTPLPGTQVAARGVSASCLHSITRYTDSGLRCLSKLSPLHYPVQRWRLKVSQQVVSTPLPGTQVAAKGVSASCLHSITRYTGSELGCLSKLSPLHYPVHR
ncbi:hypothetical protein RRG08_007425 [Elysia crispata]|uniref:Uncharacterized protein n=1 Tax=Elysia crispata TaxID=231223 RepID=A0AAE1B7T8_9GAST|nr:hypothetical protein RRG08_007425 [Elysia crispata]